MVTKFKGNNAKNARIKIDYSGVKPNVRFSYPTKKGEGFEGSMLQYIFLGWMVLMMFSQILFDITGIAEMSYLDSYEQTELQKYTICVAHNPVEAIINYDYIRYDLCERYISLFSFDSIRDFLNLNGIKLLLLFFLPPLFIYYPFRKYWANVYPNFQAALARKKIALFKEKDVKYGNEEGYYCEIPLFNNVLLDYNAKEDFSKYLKFFEIEEHKFKYYKPTKRRSKAKKSKNREKRKREREVNEWLWYAKFYFSKKPTKGELKVLFK